MHGKPAGFILRNSKGNLDFIMTMLVAVTVALFIVIIFWMVINMIGFRLSISQPEVSALSSFIQSFNLNARMIVLGLCSSVFSLAGAYYLRRSSSDKNDVETVIGALSSPLPGVNPTACKQEGVTWVAPQQSSIAHPQYDDEEEDI